MLADGLRVLLFQSDTEPRKTPTRLKTFRGNGLQGGIDPDSNAAVLDAMDER